MKKPIQVIFNEILDSIEYSGDRADLIDRIEGAQQQMILEVLLSRSDREPEARAVIAANISEKEKVEQLQSLLAGVISPEELLAILEKNATSIIQLYVRKIEPALSEEMKERISNILTEQEITYTFAQM